MNIPYQNIEIEQIFYQAFAPGHRAIAICAAESGEGVTSLVLALAQRQLLAGNSVLVVDLNLYHPTLVPLLAIEDTLATHNNKQKITMDRRYNGLFVPPALTINDKNPVVLTGITAPNKRESVMKLRKEGVLELFIEQWLTQYDSVIIDTSPLNRMNANNIPAERVAAACDAVILMVLAGKTPVASISNAITKLNNAQAHFIGSVINDRDNPSLKDELLREIDRVFSRCNWLHKYFSGLINKNRLLTLEI
ncbi:tyrosine-protein kinase family protein [Psychromonas hadalis]|uniref:tyrosine-protein kinase family protein n=1 Tax=Psychromonas hadalis TaxID=211669 RepID=UPI0003B383B1|nr:tyrosine-protein kinase family protein [Psychromonas hadalis]